MGLDEWERRAGACRLRTGACPLGLMRGLNRFASRFRIPASPSRSASGARRRRVAALPHQTRGAWGRAVPEVRTMQTGGRVVTLSLATSESWKDDDSGERHQRTEWHRVVIFNEGLGRIAEQYLAKGAKVYVEGQLRTRKWQEASGVERSATEIHP